MSTINFDTLSPTLSVLVQHHESDTAHQIFGHWQAFFDGYAHSTDLSCALSKISDHQWQTYHQTWQQLKHDPNDDLALTTWLIELFNQMFDNFALSQMPTQLVRGGGEPEYFPATDTKPARIEFAHGYFASALHEISHWCIAGKRRRTLGDFGYWYEADGRNEQTQRLFEQVEIKPQAVECLLTLACGRYFYVSQDNLDADFDTTQSTFAHDVHQQALHYLTNPNTLPTDAKRLLWTLLALCQTDYFVQIFRK